MFLAIILTSGLISILTLVLRDLIGRNGVLVLIFVCNFFFLFIISLNFFSLNLLLLYFDYWLLRSIQFGFYLNFVSLSFVFLILFITICVFLFTVSYMYFESRFIVFCSFIQFFMFFMILLVSSINLIQLFIAWEGVGIISYLLINFWFNRLDSNKGALKALFFNRFGDVGYFLFLIYIFVFNHTTDLILSIYIICMPWYVLLFLLLASFGKSAQLFLYAWLPDAMEGPTPVSSLLHSATMVTAGIFLIIRFYDLFFVFSSVYLYILIIVGSLTSIFTGLFAMTKYDIKKIIAFSTCSQLGLMLTALGFGLLNASYFHLYVHAFFKCLLFITSGVIIHAMFEEQDIRKLSSSFHSVPLFYFFILIGTLSIIGFFFMSGYYSKEYILTGLLYGSLNFKIFLFISSLFTILYSLRLFFFCFNTTILNSSPVSFIKNNIRMHIDFFHLISMSLLAFFSIVSGYIFSDSFLNYDIGYTYNQLYTHILFELINYSILFLILIFIIYICILYFYIFNKTNFVSLFYIRFIFIIFNVIVLEFTIPLIYDRIVKFFSFIIYRYLILCYDRYVLDNIFTFSWYNFFSDFYKKFNLNSHYFIIKTLHFIIVGLFLIFIYLYLATTIFVLSLVLFYLIYIDIDKKKEWKL